MNEKLDIMVKLQIEARGVLSSRVLSAMRSVDRINYVLEEYKHEAYQDYPLPIGYQQTISQPYIVAFMSELCNLRGNEKVLEIGTGSGYQTAVLSKLAYHVYSIERIAELSKRADKILAKEGCENVTLKIGDGYEGWAEYAPFDVIILTAAPEVIPDILIRQLSPDNGLLIGPEGKNLQQLVKIQRYGHQYEKEFSLAVRFVEMIKS